MLTMVVCKQQHDVQMLSKHDHFAKKKNYPKAGSSVTSCLAISLSQPGGGGAPSQTLALHAIKDGYTKFASS